MGRHIQDNTDAAAQEADDRITEEGVQPALRYEIFGTSTCPYCDKAKELLTKLNKEFVFYNIDEDEQAFDQLIGRIKSWKTVPQIFYGANHIGGFQELEASLVCFKVDPAAFKIIKSRDKERVDELIEANNRYLLRARVSEELLQEALDRFEPTDKDGLEFVKTLQEHLKAPWLLPSRSDSQPEDRNL